MTTHAAAWPSLPLESWRDTKDTLHMYTQVIGKIRMTLMPKMNQTWHVALYVSGRGLTTGPMPVGAQSLEIEFDLIDHRLVFRMSDGERRSFPLGGSVRDFYHRVMGTLEALHVDVDIWPMPVEVADPIRFERDTHHATYEPEAVERFWPVLTRVNAAFTRFRAAFTGKASPVHFFWGSFDLAVTRFSGKPAAPAPGMTGFMAEAYNAELISVGFWPGGDWPGVGTFEEPFFYAYTYPQPEGIERASIAPAEARWHPQLREFILPYEDVRTSADPVGMILAFAQSTYEAGATLARWPVEQFLLEAAPSAPEREQARITQLTIFPSTSSRDDLAAGTADDRARSLGKGGQ